jgi:23S rRNA pseudouridine955/2504/2580 synthase
VRHFVVEAEAGQRIDNFLARELKDVPKSRLYRMLRSGEVRVNGGRVKPAYRLAAGDRIRVPPLEIRAATGTAADASAFVGDRLLERLSKAIIFEDDHLLALDKPAGLAVHGGSGLAFGVVEALRRLRPSDDLHLAHRLDRDTSGCLLLAKSRPVLLAVHRALREREVGKRYVAIVSGRWPRRVTTVQQPLERYHLASGERRVRVAAAGKPSRTDFHVREAAPRATLLEARLHTGRTHQIRVHAKARGHPLIGDEKYAEPEQLALARSLGVRRLCLHAEELVFMHEGRRLRLHAPLPADLASAWAALRALA